MVINDLLGPAGGPEEELDQREDRVTGRYLVGMLAPKSTAVEAEEQDALGTDETDDPEVGATDASTPPASTFFPNSIGMSFVVESEAKSILIKTRMGTLSAGEERDASEQEDRRRGNVWKREPFIGDPLIVPLKNGPFGPLQPRPDTDSCSDRAGQDAADAPRLGGDSVSSSTPSRNKITEKDEAWVFQPKLWVLDAAVPPQPIFVQRRDWQHDLTKMDSDHAGGNRNAGNALPAPAGICCRAWRVHSHHAAGTGSHSRADD